MVQSLSKGDIEATGRPKEFLKGFADFSQYIATDSELSIYRSFRALGARNILYLQAELQVLEHQLFLLDRRDSCRLADMQRDDQEQIDSAAREWKKFEEHSNDSDGPQWEKMQLVMRIRQVMKDYGNYALPIKYFTPNTM